MKQVFRVIVEVTLVGAPRRITNADVDFILRQTFAEQEGRMQVDPQAIEELTGTTELFPERTPGAATILGEPE